jgi:hypothetical protein
MVNFGVEGNSGIFQSIGEDNKRMVIAHDKISKYVIKPSATQIPNENIIGYIDIVVPGQEFQLKHAPVCTHKGQCSQGIGVPGSEWSRGGFFFHELLPKDKAFWRMSQEGI